MKRTTVDQFMSSRRRNLSSSGVSYVDSSAFLIWESGDVTTTAAGWAHIFRDGGGEGRGINARGLASGGEGKRINLGRRGLAGGSTYRSTIEERMRSILGDLLILLGFYVEREQPRVLLCKRCYDLGHLGAQKNRGTRVGLDLVANLIFRYRHSGSVTLRPKESQGREQ